MFNLFKKKNKKWVRFYSLHPGVAELHPWIPANKLHRKWRDDALKTYYNRTSKCPAVKLKNMWEHYSSKVSGNYDGNYDGLFNHAVTCPALTGLMDTGWVVTVPADIIIKMTGDKKDFGWVAQVMFDSGGPTYVKGHVPEQTEGIRDLVDQQREVTEQTIKLELPWRVQAHKDIVFMQIPVPYYPEPRFSVATGFVDPSYSYEVNMQLFWHAVEEGEYLIKAGTPLAQWIPMDRNLFNRKDWEVVIETANDEDIKNNKVMDYNRYMHFIEMVSLKERIDKHKAVLALNKNKQRFE